MGIELPTPLFKPPGSPENRPLGYGNEQGKADTYASRGESQNSNNAEQYTTKSESSPEVANGMGAGENSYQPVQAVAVNTTLATATPVYAVSALDDVPVVAADEDLIEKVWVDAVKSVIGRTAGDPYARSAAIGKLQADYLQKRYGKTIGGE